MSLKIIIGLILIAINVPVGWGGAALFGYRAKETGEKKYYLCACLIYAISWLILLAGIYLCGSEYKLYINNPYFKYGIPTAVIVAIVAIILIKKSKKKK